MVQFVNNCKNYNNTIPKHKSKRKRRVKKSDHKHEYELYRAFERSAWGGASAPIHRTIVGHCIHCNKIIQGNHLLVERGYVDKNYGWFRQVDFSKYDFPIIYVKWDNHLNLVQITDPYEVYEMKLQIQADIKRRLERSAQ